MFGVTVFEAVTLMPTLIWLTRSSLDLESDSLPSGNQGSKRLILLPILRSNHRHTGQELAMPAAIEVRKVDYLEELSAKCVLKRIRIKGRSESAR